MSAYSGYWIVGRPPQGAAWTTWVPWLDWNPWHVAVPGETP